VGEDDREACVRKFIFNASVIGALLGGIGVIRSTARGPRDWRLILGWVSWLATLAIAVGTVIEDSKELED
jgi:hypothetical protein